MRGAGGESRRAGPQLGRARLSTPDESRALDIAVADIAGRMGVSPAGLYRYFPAAGAANSLSP